MAHRRHQRRVGLAGGQHCVQMLGLAGTRRPEATGLRIITTIRASAVSTASYRAKTIAQ